MIRNNLHKYSVLAMCKVLKISRSTYYYEAKLKPDEGILEENIIDVFKASRKEKLSALIAEDKEASIDLY